MTKTELESKHLADLHQLAAAAGVERYRMLTRAELIEALSNGNGDAAASSQAGSDADGERSERPRRRRRSGSGGREREAHVEDEDEDEKPAAKPARRGAAPP